MASAFERWLLLLLMVNWAASRSAKFSWEQSLVYGPGLKADFAVPARYFFIQAVDINGQNFTTSPPGELQVRVLGEKETCPFQIQVFDRKDGLFIARFKALQACSAVVITVTYKGRLVGKSPYFIGGPVLPDTYNCPVVARQWLTAMECPRNYSQIDADLQPFAKVDMVSVLKDALDRFHRPASTSFCHYVVVNNEVYRKCYGQHTGFSMFMDNILHFLARKIQLPDLEMLVNLGDWPLETRVVDPIPFLSWCGSAGTRDIVLPTYDVTESSLEMMSRVTLDMLSAQGNPGPKWEDKVSKGFWRGRDSRQERLDLVKLSRSHPELVDAALTNFFFFREQEKEYGPKVPHISFFDFFKYKYQVTLDGTVAAYRLPYLLSGNSVVLKQDSEYYEHFYGHLTPWVHYIPFRRDLSNLVDVIRWAQKHDDEARKTAKYAQQFALDHLLPRDILCYHMMLFREYAKRLIRRPEVRPGLEHIPQPDTTRPCPPEYKEREAHGEL